MRYALRKPARPPAQDLAPAPPQGSPLVTLLLVGAVGFAVWSYYKPNPAPGPAPVPVPVARDATLARYVFPVCAKLQSENYAKAAVRLRAGDSVMAVNEELQKLNAAAIDAAYKDLDEWMAVVLTDATPEATATVYENLSKEFVRAP